MLPYVRQQRLPAESVRNRANRLRERFGVHLTKFVARPSKFRATATQRARSANDPQRSALLVGLQAISVEAVPEPGCSVATAVRVSHPQR